MNDNTANVPNADNARARLGPPMVALFGSVLNRNTDAWDVDVVYHGVTPEEAAEAARGWCMKHRPEMIGDRGDFPVDLHEAKWCPPRGDTGGYFEPLQAVEWTDPVLALVGPAPAVVVNHVSLPRAVRFFARHGHLPSNGMFRLGVAENSSDEYFGGGRQALLTAVTKVRFEKRVDLFVALGPVFKLLVERAPTPGEIEMLRRGSPNGAVGIDWARTGLLWAPRTTHSRWLTVQNGRIVEVAD